MNLVNELQVSAENDDVLTVLRKTKRLASKLGRNDIAQWLASEQNGYKHGDKVPDYRMVSTSLAFNSHHYIPAGYGHLTKGVQEIPSNGLTSPTSFHEPISAVLQIIKVLQEGGGYYSEIEGTEYGDLIRKHIKFHPLIAGQISLLLQFNSTQIQAIPEQLKDRVLDWACDLEAAGVYGDGLTFSASEKEKAHAVTINIHDSQIEQLNNSGVNRKEIA